MAKNKKVSAEKLLNEINDCLSKINGDYSALEVICGISLYASELIGYYFEKREDIEEHYKETLSHALNIYDDPNKLLDLEECERLNKNTEA